MQGTGRLTRRRVLGLLAVGVVGVVATPALAACGSTTAGANGTSGGFSSEPAAQRVEVSAAPDGTLRWDRAAYQAKAGDVTFVVKNPSPIQHRFGVEGNGLNAHSGDLAAGKTGTYTLTGLRAGEYQIVCDYPGHRAAGMVARLTVG
jgi:uncharacterized cupredoxin-like copper-binding protein